MAAMSKVKETAILGKRNSRFGDSRDVKRVQFGLGESPGTVGAGEKCLRCSFGNIPVIEEVVWTIPLPLTADEALSTLGDTVNLLSGSSSVPGVASIDSTFLINGILQTDILAQGIGVHVFHEPMSFSTIGNSFAAPDASATPPPSPDVWTTTICSTVRSVDSSLERAPPRTLPQLRRCSSSVSTSGVQAGTSSTPTSSSGRRRSANSC